MSGVPLLGILPNLPDLLTDPRQAAVAAHCVHQIRTLLQIRVQAEDNQVFAVTSASPGDGKTSLTLALGLSFAASGCNTLLIDCDLVGGALTRRLKVNSEDGVLDAMASRSVMAHTQQTDIENVSILPAGSAGFHHASSFSPRRSPAAHQRRSQTLRRNSDRHRPDPRQHRSFRSCGQRRWSNPCSIARAAADACGAISGSLGIRGGALRRCCVQSRRDARL